MPSTVDRYFKEIKDSNPEYSDSQAWATAWSVYCKHKNPGSEHCKMNPEDYLKGKSAFHVATATRVASRFLEKTSGRGLGWDGKFLGKDCRLQWSDVVWKLEELPTKGKKKVKVGEHQNGYGMYSGVAHLDALIPANILRVAKLSASDTYDKVKDKIGQAMQDAATEISAKNPRWDFLKKNQWYEHDEFYLNIMPEGSEPFSAEGKDFTVSLKWTEWSAYSPESDFQQSDPHYTQYASSSPQHARKMYQILKSDPNALKSVPWTKFSDWLKSNKINYKINFSSWG
jgi:hypothetical protein